METSQLETFIAVCDAGTFTAAARLRHIGQSAVSASIASLERDVGAELFVRTRKTAVLTAEGTALLPYARRMIASQREGYAAVSSARGRVAGEVRVGITAALGRLELGRMIVDLHRDHPDVRVHLLQSMMGSRGHLDLLRTKQLDLALISVPDDRSVPGDVQVEVLLVEPVVAALSLGDRLARRRRVRTTDLRDRAYLALPAGWGAREVVDDALQPLGGPVVEASDYGLLADLVAADLGVAFWPKSAAPARDDVAQVRTELEWRLLLATHRDPLSSATQVVADSLRSVAAQLSTG